MNFTLTEFTPEQIKQTQEWLRRALANAKAARILVEQDDPDLLVEAVSQVQQACEKATKAILLAHCATYSEVTSLGHNTIGAFTTLIARIMQGIPFAEDFLRALLKEDAGEAANLLGRVVLSGRRNRERRNDVIYAFKQMLPRPSSEPLGSKALEVAEWDRLTRSFPPQVVEMLIDMHVRHKEMWSQYNSGIRKVRVDPRPLLSKEVDAETWVFDPDYAGLSRRLPGQEYDIPTNPELSQLVQQILNYSVSQLLHQADQSSWPSAINIRIILLHLAKWLTSLGWLFLCATITTPHAVSSRYPAEIFQSETVKGSQHYSKRLGVVACIRPLAQHTDEVIRNLIAHFKRSESDFSSMLP